MRVRITMLFFIFFSLSFSEKNNFWIIERYGCQFKIN